VHWMDWDIRMEIAGMYILKTIFLLKVREVSYQPPGTQLKLLNSVSFSLPEKRYVIVCVFVSWYY